MPTRFDFARFALVVCLTTSTVALAAEDAVFKAGFAEKDITPEVGMEQPGGYGKSYHTKFHDACKVRASVFDDGKKRVAVVGLDALFIPRSIVLAARDAIQKRVGIAPECVLISASHSHSSGPVAGIFPGEYDHASPLVQKLAYEQSTTVHPQYAKKVEQALIDAVCEANDTRVSAKCGVGKGIEDQVAFNRRFRMRDGLTATHPRQGNPDIVEVAGPIDPEVGVIGAWDQRGRLIGCVVNYACHATTNPGGISANYIFYLEQAVRGFFGPDVVVVFVPGASGDITQVDNLSPYDRQQPEQSARFVGGRIGAETVKVLLTMEPGNLGPVDAKNEVLKVKHRIPRPERVAQSLELVQKDRSKVDITEWTFAKEIVLLDAKLKLGTVADVEVQALQVGPVVFVTDSAEYFCQFGLDIKKGSPFPFTFPVSLANGSVGYVPTEEAFSPRGGGYETRLSSYSNLEITAGKKFADAGIALAKQLTPGKVPTLPPAPPYKKNAWAYGAVPPELD